MRGFLRRTGLVVLGLMLIVTACRAPSPDAPEAIERQLKEADRAFAAATAERGIDGWMSYFTDDAARVAFHGPISRGPDEIRAFDLQIFGNPELRLHWEPTDAGAFATGDHGFTRGRYRLERMAAGADEPETLSTGEYLSIWRREADGWKVILDTGSPDRRAEEDPGN